MCGSICQMLVVLTNVQGLLSGHEDTKGSLSPPTSPCLQNARVWESERDVMVQIHQGRWASEGFFPNLKYDPPLSHVYLDVQLRGCIPGPCPMLDCETLVDWNWLCSSFCLYGNLHTTGTQLIWQMQYAKEGIGRRARPKESMVKSSIF